MRTLLCGFLISLMGSSLVSAEAAAQERFWERPFQEWSASEVDRMLVDSPWSGQVTLTSSEWSGEEEVEQEISTTYTFRLFSSYPVRAAFLQAFRLLNRVDSLPPAKQQKFAAQYGLELPEGEQNVIISVEVSSESLSLENRIKNALGRNLLETLQRNIFLTSPRLGQVPLSGFRPAAPDGTGIKLIFPGSVAGKPLLTPDDPGLTLELTVPWMPVTATYTWKTEQLFFEGELTY